MSALYLVQDRSNLGLGLHVASFTTLRGWGTAKTLWWSRSSELKVDEVPLGKQPCPPIFP